MTPVARAPAVAGALLVVALSVGGCATPQVSALLASRPPALAERTELVAVPFYPQEAYQCGPAALATTLTHAGVPTAPEALVSQVYLPAREGSLQAEMLATPRRHGLVSYRLAPRLDHLLQEVAAGTPVVVFQNLAFAFVPQWHYAVVVGYDLPGEEIILRSGTTRRLVTTLSNFERTWARGDYWAVVTLPPGQLPVTATEDRYVAAVTALERVSAESARRAYRAALERWPGNLIAQIGLGNTAYTQRDLSAAEAAYREATRQYPEAADAWNNLAQTLLELRRRDEAQAAAQRAVAIGGPRLSQYQETLRAVIESR